MIWYFPVPMSRLLLNTPLATPPHKWTKEYGISFINYLHCMPKMSAADEKKLSSSDAPPPYSATVPGGGPDVPPTYQELFGGMTGINDMRSGVQGVRNSSDPGGRATGLFKVCCALFGTVFCSICYLVISAWPIALIVVGAIDLHNCRLNRNIPVWMIVYGCFSLVLTAISIGKQCCCKKSKEERDEEGQRGNRKKNGCNMCESIILVFLIVWVFVGSSWVLGNYDEYRAGPGSCKDFTGNITSPLYYKCCEPGTYLFAFGSILVVYILWGLCCCGVIAAACVGLCCVLGSGDDDD